MSNYAGPILGVVGAVIGSFVPGLGTAAGWAIGSAIGSMISSSMQVLPGPKIGDVQSQTAIEGGFRPFLYGRSTPIAGNVIADHEPYIVKKRERQGKGGPKVESESAYRTYAVGFCEGEASLLQVWRNGILVYDAEDPGMAPENAEFLKYARWHTGSFQQMPDPSIEGTHGVGNAPAFRGTAYLVLTREDVTDQRGAWSQWQVRVFRGTKKSYTTAPYPVYWNDDLAVAARANGGGIPSWPTEGVDFSLTPKGGLVRSVILPYNIAPEGVNAALSPVGGDVYTTVMNYGNYAPEELALVAQPIGGDVYVTVLSYTNYAPESINSSLTPLGGQVS